MNKVTAIRVAISATLAAVHGQVHYEHAPNNATYPYLVYNLPYSLDSGTLEQFTLDVDGWDNDTDTTALEDMMYKADQALHRTSVIVDNLALIIYRDNRLILDEKESRLRRRKYVYQIRAYEGGN
jgi:hypothetical protein